MLAIFKKGLVNPPQELNSPASLASSRKPKLPQEILKDFESSNALSISFGDVASLAYIPSQNPYAIHQKYPSDLLNGERFFFLLVYNFLSAYTLQVVLWIERHVLHFLGELKQPMQPH